MKPTRGMGMVLTGAVLVTLAGAAAWERLIAVSGNEAPSRRAPTVSGNPGAQARGAGTVLRRGANLTPESVPAAAQASWLSQPWSVERLGIALESIAAEPDLKRREHELERLEEALSATPSAAVTMLATLDRSECGDDLRLRLIRAWARRDPQAAAAWVGRIERGAGRQEAIDGVAIVWVGQDVAGAIAWVRGLANDGERNAGLIGIAYELARTAPLESLRLAAETPPTRARDDLVAHAAGEWAAHAPRDAVDWGRQVHEHALRAQILARVATVWSERNPAEAAELAVSSIPPGRAQDDAVVGIVQRWTQANPADAMRWVAAFPEGPLRVIALENVARLRSDAPVPGAAPQ